MNNTPFQPDDRQDRALASDQKSRYGAYLAHTTRLFRCDGDEQPPTMCAVRFAIAAWTAAGPRSWRPATCACTPASNARTFTGTTPAPHSRCTSPYPHLWKQSD